MRSSRLSALYFALLLPNFLFAAAVDSIDTNGSTASGCDTDQCLAIKQAGQNSLNAAMPAEGSAASMGTNGTAIQGLAHSAAAELDACNTTSSCQAAKAHADSVVAQIAAMGAAPIAQGIASMAQSGHSISNAANNAGKLNGVVKPAQNPLDHLYDGRSLTNGTLQAQEAASPRGPPQKSSGRSSLGPIGPAAEAAASDLPRLPEPQPGPYGTHPGETANPSYWYSQSQEGPPSERTSFADLNQDGQPIAERIGTASTAYDRNGAAWALPDAEKPATGFGPIQNAHYDGFKSSPSSSTNAQPHRDESAALDGISAAPQNDGPQKLRAQQTEEPRKLQVQQTAEPRATGITTRSGTYIHLMWEPNTGDELRDQMLRTLDLRLYTDGVGPEAANKAHRIYRDMLQRLPNEVLKKLVLNKSKLVIIPKNRSLTDLPQFEKFKGRLLPDNRKYDELRGLAGVDTPDGGKVTAVAEENFLGKDGDDGYLSRGFVFVHETGHTIHLLGLRYLDPKYDRTQPAPPNSQETGPHWWGRDLSLFGVQWNPFYEKPEPKIPAYAEVAKIYWETVRRPGGTGLGPYADSNEYEFFAQATAAYLGYPYYYDERLGPKSPVVTREELRLRNPKMYDLMIRMYGPPPP